MICHMPVCVGAGDLPDHQIKACCKALFDAWGGVLVQYSAQQSPINVLGNLPPSKGLVQLLGDPAKTLLDGCNWLEALGSWKHPTILISNCSSGGVSGSAQAYLALCKQLSVPVLGLVQYGGSWEPELRRLDGLPWYGWIPEKNEKEFGLEMNDYELQLVESIVMRLSKRLKIFSEVIT